MTPESSTKPNLSDDEHTVWAFVFLFMGIYFLFERVACVFVCPATRVTAPVGPCGLHPVLEVCVKGLLDFILVAHLYVCACVCTSRTECHVKRTDIVYTTVCVFLLLCRWKGRGREREVCRNSIHCPPLFIVKNRVEATAKACHWIEHKRRG